MKSGVYDEVMSFAKDYIDTINALYQLKANDEEEIDAFYKFLKTNLLDTKLYKPGELIREIQDVAVFNNRYFKSFWTIAKRIFEDYQPKVIERITPLFDYFFYKEYGIVFNETNKKYFNQFEAKNYSIDVHEENSIYKAIMKNDIKSFIIFTEMDGFDKDQKYSSNFYPRQSTSYTLIELCCYHGAVDCFKLLRSKFNSKITHKCLHFSFLSGNPEILNECLKYEKPCRDCISYAIISHNIDFVTYLMNEHNIPIYINCCNDFNNLQTYLIGLEQTNDFNSCFLHRPYFHLPAFYKYILDHCPDITKKGNFYGRRAFENVINENRYDIAEILISHGVDVNIMNDVEESALHLAAINGRKELVELFISNGVDVNIKERYNHTPLHYAAKNGNKEIVQLLIDNGAVVNAKNNQNITPIHETLNNKNTEALEILIANGADVNAITADGYSPLHMAIYICNSNAAEVLLSHGADINKTNYLNETALHIAAKENKIDMVKLLISHGADVNIRNYEKKSALDYAVNKNYKEIADILISHGDVNSNSNV
ncbi:hypothetical protein TVAG_363660 [Trichomonas vaginalis G3]|uniref:DUF3447 domain-containing protein n=1 Tax=Trichomonas vaginalis (strain ATCC PRA-98 / G3) TaxID=412133 RepID=A2EDT5_TRIV3|nr:spectrin binding [Trichomonas vaginalis G3]EAY09151.1 hypothetical protein TVAG_363660 [Trichomonas vaginalis G3]KAI5487060.1 spectrin binding [Trichomonas vaginalis G3]|eukprot:XP_001321374.1 hypothetical protein [Trichomonas vaginalis G3]